MTEKKVVAYQVDREDGEGSVIVFDSHGMAARRRGAQMLDMGGDDEYCNVKRAKHFDHLAEKGFVPVKDLLEAGWWHGTAFDGYHLKEAWEGEIPEEEEDEYWDEGYYYQSVRLVYFQNEQGVWRDWDEMERHAYSINAAMDRLTWWKETVQKCYPQLTFTKFTGGPMYYTHTAEYTFPGAKYGGHIRWDWEEGQETDPKVHFTSLIAQGDKEAFDKYMETVV